ncbi:response regulator transcription factor [Rhodohalobacter sulfatireducens]|uniref:Response regulator transcription factor n=1 Tax=Rhodohalobacter sulfatireducens TaxID=2911366 RepID=A0ABS9KEK1_9BACT|nr:response regulator transcription factor [Rhodohalobacter sulfatireducens]MCG2589287.1 response regulator transcription factor [Rhodohalobacter sulfatireducens]MDR9366963.1 response regulator transcription factor [Balneolaceae bacterium]MDR9410634.1 response regulator transcription factor [Balneolaceae bacterium]
MSDKSKKILIVEDEPSLVFTLKDTLEAENYDVNVVEDGAEAVETVQQFEPDLMILDLMLPNVSGYEICKEIRDLKYTFPIIMLTAKDQEIDKVTGLNLGADDYITKPFGVKELLARIRARLRRANAYSKSGPAGLLKLGDIKIDLNDGKVFKPNQKEEELSTREVEIIEFFLSNANRPISRDDLLEKVWRYEYSTNTRTVDVHISKLRAKIEKNPDDPKYLVTLHGVGYMLRLN